jgi:hypothetical protein
MTIDRRLLLAGTAAALTAAGGAVQAQDRAMLLKTLLELEINSWQYTKDKNVAAMQTYLADEAVLIFGDGSRFTKAEFLKGLPTFRVDSFDVDRKSGELLTPTADVACLLYRVTYNPGTGPMKVLSSNTYVRRSGGWQSALYQETRAA